MKATHICDILESQFGEKFSGFLPFPEEEITFLLTDSRNHFNPESSLFFAINTSGGNDGHKYIMELYKKGVRNFVVEKIPTQFIKNESSESELSLTANFFVVPDTIKALTAIGAFQRKDAKNVVAICGSRGKTTLKEILFQLLEKEKNICRSPRSYNSKIGVPLSLWQIKPENDLVIIEAGVSEKNEMIRLQEAIAPDTVIFTNIGDAHSQGFSSIEEKAHEKTLMAQHENVKKIIYNIDSYLLHSNLMTLEGQKKLIRWSLTNPESEVFIEVSKSDKEGVSRLTYTFGNIKGQLRFKNEKSFDIENTANALTFMLSEGLNEEQISENFKHLTGIKTRLNVSEGINGCTVVLDSYTSDFSSLQPALDFVSRRKTPGQDITLILSDLHHNAPDSEKIYSEISKTLKENCVKRFIGIGPQLKHYSFLFPENANFFSDTETFLKKFSASDFHNEIILLKGSPDFAFQNIYEELEAKKHETVLEVNLDAMLRNYNYFKSHIPSTTGIIAMVKASGYGAGSYEIAKTLQDAGASYLAVAALDEGVDLRDKGIVMPIMVMNPRSANYNALFINNLQPVIYSLSMLKEFISEADKYSVPSYPVHLKLDTGMHRMGFEEKDLDELIKILGEESRIHVATIFSHLATADCLDMDSFTELQIKRFQNFYDKIKAGLSYPVKRHILNSAGILRFPNFCFDYVRLGIGLYGANTLPQEIEKTLSPVATLRSVIICIREIGPSETVGYARKGKIDRVSRIATIPIGYADGMNRHFGNGALKVLVNGVKVPTIGNICMDATMLDVTDVDCKEGDSVEIFGTGININDLALTLDTIPYEILTSVSPRVKRVYYRE